MLQWRQTEGEVGGAEILLETLSTRDLEIQTLNITIIWNEGAESVRAYIYMGIWRLSALNFGRIFTLNRAKGSADVKTCLTTLTCDPLGTLT